MSEIDQVRAAVADALEGRGLGNPQFIEEVRRGLRDDGPYMLGALTWANRGERRVTDE
ncbi:MAG: hypothetical protein AB7E60_09810 [Sphingobium sp.]